MPVNLSDATLSPLSQLVTAETLPLADYLPSDQAATTLAGIYFSDATSSSDGTNLVIDLTLAYQQPLTLSIPGCTSFRFEIAAAGAWTGVNATLTLGPDLSLQLREVEFALVFSPEVLSPVAGGESRVTFTADLLFTPDGLFLENSSGASLPPSFVCGTGVTIEAQDVRAHFGNAAAPGYVPGGSSFRGVSFDQFTVTLPADFQGAAPLTFAARNASVGTTGFSGDLSLEGSLPSAKWFNFECRIRAVRLAFLENAVLESSLAFDLHLAALKQDSWIGLDFTIGAKGTFAAALSLEQPAEAASDDNAPFNVTFDDVVSFAFHGIRVEKRDNGLSVWLSGSARLLLTAMRNWPSLPFEQIGITSDGQITLPDGAGMVLTKPLVVDWNLARLTVAKLRFGRLPSGHFSLSLDAAIVIAEGLPAGASVEGLTIAWDSNGLEGVTFDGIGLDLTVPGSFRAALSVSYRSNGTREFHGRGRLELTSLDIALDVSVLSGETKEEGKDTSFSYLYLFAEASVIPSGIPIGATGLSLYGVQGLVAHNMRLGVDENGGPFRYYDHLFKGPPETAGLMTKDKFVAARGRHALGLGVIVGTSDQGFAFNATGLLVVTLPDLTILLQCRANVLKQRTPLGTKEQAALQALMVYDGTAQALTFDIVARWTMEELFDVDGHARAFFSFRDPGSWFVQLGTESAPITARALQFRGRWLFAAGFWFEIKPGVAQTGLVWDVRLEYGSTNGFFLELAAHLKAKMTLSWQPAQWGANATFTGYASGGYRNLRAGVAITSDTDVTAAHPFKLELRATLCFQAFRWRACFAHQFRWIEEKPGPTVLPAIRLATATPKHWTPAADAPDNGLPIELAFTSPLVQPHAAIQLDFVRKVVDATGSNEALKDFAAEQLGGSDYTLKYGLTKLTLTRVGGAAATPARTWLNPTPVAKTHAEAGTSLKLYSSERYAHKGSLSESFTENIDLSYCDKRAPVPICVTLANLRPGWGTLEDGTPYFWDISTKPDGVRDNVGGLKLARGDIFTVYAPPSWMDVKVIVRYAGGSEGEVTLAGPDLALREGLADGGTFLRICREGGFITDRQYGRIVTTSETWSLPDDAQYLVPGATYELAVTAETVLNGIAAPNDYKYTFKVANPPSYRGALEHYIAGRYPADGTRPVYTGYDIIVRLVDPYVSLMYAAAARDLVIRLFDHEGMPVKDPVTGAPVLIPTLVGGSVTKSRTQQVWEAIVHRDLNCILDDVPDYKLPPQEEKNTLSLPVVRFRMKPNSQYSAELISLNVGAPDTPLATWSFTTSSFAKFEDMMALRVTRPAVIARASLAGATFDDAMRRLSLPAVAYVDVVNLTPILNDIGTRCVGVLIEAPEPLETSLRLTVASGGQVAEVYANHDETRALFLLDEWIPPSGRVALTLTWLRDPGRDAEHRRSVANDLKSEEISIDLECGVWT